MFWYEKNLYQPLRQRASPVREFLGVNLTRKCFLSYEMAIAEEVVSYHVPPAMGLQSNTRIVSMAPDPMAATCRMLWNNLDSV